MNTNRRLSSTGRLVLIGALAVTQAQAAAPEKGDATLPALVSVPPELAKAVEKQLQKSSVAQLPLQGVALVAAGSPENRLLYAQAGLEYVAQTQPAALRSLLASLSTAYPELAPDAALVAAKASPAQLPNLVSAAVTAAPGRIDETLAILSHEFPENRAAITAAAEKVYPDLKNPIAAAVARGADTTFRRIGTPDATPPARENTPAASRGEQPDSYEQAKNYGKGPKSGRDYAAP